jgi:hypothetical protein
MFRGSVKGTGYPLHSPVSSSIPLPCVAVCHHVLIGLYSSTDRAYNGRYGLLDTGHNKLRWTAIKGDDRRYERLSNVGMVYPSIPRQKDSIM